MNGTEVKTATGRVLRFDEGIPGFPEAREFVLHDLDEAGTFQVLQSVENPEIALVVCSPWLLVPDYEAVLSEDDERELALTDPDDAVVFCAVTLDEAARAFHLNLLGPFVVNARTQRGRQVVLTESGHPVRHTVHLDDDTTD